MIRLARGEPDIPTPKHIIEAAKAALDEGRTGYTDPAGMPVLRDAISRKVAAGGLIYDPATEIIVTSGGQEGIALAMQTLLDPGDEVILAVPTYTSYEANVVLAGGVPVWVHTRLEDDFALLPDAVTNALTPRSKLLAIVSPNNPTATVLTPPQLGALARVAAERNLLILSDELYSEIRYDGLKSISIATFPGMRDRTIVVNGFSKTYSMTGFRVGYMLGPADYIRATVEPRHSFSISTPMVSQYAALAALEGPQEFIAQMISEYTTRRDTMAKAFDDLGIPYSLPQAAFYFWADISATGLPSVEFCQRGIRDHGVWFSPGASFGEGAEGFIRISFLAPPDVLAEALRRFGSLYRESIGRD
ncbi:MAG: aminotransferase class I/II-fold pyridoxal phosphate-dependent enzyme [Candidatus Dormiibacterota bacterium]